MEGVTGGGEGRGAAGWKCQAEGGGGGIHGQGRVRGVEMRVEGAIRTARPRRLGVSCFVEGAVVNLHCVHMCQSLCCQSCACSAPSQHRPLLLFPCNTYMHAC